MKNLILFTILLVVGLMSSCATTAQSASPTTRILVLEDDSNEDFHKLVALLQNEKIFPDLKAEFLPWKEIREKDLDDYSVVVVPSRLYTKIVNGFSAVVPQALEAVRSRGTGLLVLNNIVAFQSEHLGSDWLDLDLNTVMPLHSDKVLELPFVKVLHAIDPQLEISAFDTQHPETIPFATYVIKQGTGEPAFGWFEVKSDSTWKIEVQGTDLNGVSRAIVLSKQYGKGKVYLTTGFPDLDSLNDKNKLLEFSHLIKSLGSNHVDQ